MSLRHGGSSTVDVLENKVATLTNTLTTVDSSPTSGSTNLVTSGGVHTAIASAGGGGGTPDMGVLDGPTSGSAPALSSGLLSTVFTETIASGVSTSNGVVTIENAGYYRLTFTCNMWNTRDIIQHAACFIYYQSDGSAPSTSSPDFRFMFIPNGAYNSTTSENVLHWGGTVSVIANLPLGTKLQCGVQYFTDGTGVMLLSTNDVTQFSGVKIA